MNKTQADPLQDLEGQCLPRCQDRLRPSSCPAPKLPLWARIWGLGEERSLASVGQQGDKACPRSPGSPLGMSKGTVTIVSNCRDRYSNNELDILKFQLCWKSGLSFLWSGAGPRSLCSLDRLGHREGPASQSVWPGLKVCSGQRPAVRLECGHHATARHSAGETGPCCLLFPDPRLGKPWHPADGAPGSSRGLGSSQGVARCDPSLSVQACGLPPWRPGSPAPFPSEVEASPAGPSLEVFRVSPARHS